MQPTFLRGGRLRGDVPRADTSVSAGELLEAALGAEHDVRRWQAEFAWLLAHPALAPVAAAGGHELSVRNIAGQHAARFPLVSGDPEWLRNRSMPVVARRLAPLFAAGCEAALDVTSVARGDTTRESSAEQMRLVAAGLAEALPSALRRYGFDLAPLTLCASAEHPGLGELLRLRGCAALGRPRIVVRVPDRLMLALRADGERDHGEREESLRTWHGLTGLVHRQPGFHLVLQQTTRPACALAGAERADAVLPWSLFEARAETAWLAVAIRVDALRSGSPAEGLAEVRRLLRACLRLADDLVDQLEWPTPELAQDALVNRRLAVHVTGIGAAVDRWGLDPAAFPTVRLADRWVGLLRQLMLRESNALARERGPFPGLELRDLASTLSRSLGDERASRLLRQAGLRHRHLLVLSPYAVLPAQTSRHPPAAYLHLLPVLRWADTVAMHGDALARTLPVSAFRRLLRMTWAIAHNRP
jgi:hypothetical protein